MEVRILDVAHGFCAYVVTDNNKVVLIDCGRNEETGFEPSVYLTHRGYSTVDQFIVSNYDEDHLSDLPKMVRRIKILTLTRNPSITADQLEELKLLAGSIAPGMQALLGMIREYSQGFVVGPEDFGEVKFSRFYNKYPHFNDTNNLSLVTFLTYQNVRMIFPGDLEREGWLSLLELESFRKSLGQVNLFVASHHGRESGYCEEVFDFCSPNLIIISDESIQYDTQAVDYSQHSSGILFDGEIIRKVVTTRSDGMITIHQDPGANFVVRIR